MPEARVRLATGEARLEELAKAGVLLDGSGLQPSSKGWRITWACGEKTVIDGPSVAVEGTDTHRAIDAVWRIEQARLIAGLARIVRDVGTAEELAQDALEAARRKWPEAGIPDRPGAWLMATAKDRAIDRLRRDARLARKLEALGHMAKIEAEAS